MLKLRLLATADIPVIHDWPPYPPEFEGLDYALRSNGWLAEFQGKPDTWVYVAQHENEIIAFSSLAKTGTTAAEFRIALRADKIGQGMGKTITCMTLHEGFSSIGLSRIHLIVRKNNFRAMRLYQKIGFRVCAECDKMAAGRLVSFFEMTISRPT